MDFSGYFRISHKPTRLDDCFGSVRDMSVSEDWLCLDHALTVIVESLADTGEIVSRSETCRSGNEVLNEINERRMRSI